MQVKNAAQTSKGYQYQSLYAAKLMIESLSGENEYEKFIIEADNTDIAETAIDDIVCYKANNEIDYYQVKHTDNTQEHDLTFEWLFEKDRNIFDKMFNSYKKQIQKNNINNIFFITTREADISFDICLDDNGSLIYEQIDKKNVQIINKLFGKELSVFKDFLKVLRFKTTENYGLLKSVIQKKLSQLSTETDFYKYIDTVQTWATNKNIPNKDGFINKDNIKNAIINKKEYLDQAFNIDKDYIELENFNKKFTEKIKKNKLTVLYGDAGTGKSSFIASFLKNIKNHIRHYYFLSVHQPSDQKRIEIENIEESFKKQLREIIGENFENFENSNLKEIIEFHDSNCDIHSNPFYIVIDGIDHVYRNNNSDIKPLSDFVDFIFKLNLKNTKIIISTQMSNLAIYPEILIRELPKKEWIEINRLTKKEIFKYIRNQNFFIKDQLNITKITQLLYEKIQGHPLLLYYIKENFKKNNIINKDNLDKIQVCETINDYYDYILRNMDRYEKFIIFSMSKYNFVWYGKYLEEIINLTFEKVVINNEKKLEKLENNTIHFLLKKTYGNGFVFYHESLLRYVKEKETKIISDSAKRKNYILKLNEWIKYNSPEYIKNIWGNMLILKEGNVPSNIDYSWVAKRVSEGYSLIKLKEILSLCVKNSRTNKRYAEMHYFNDLLYRLKSEWNLFLEDEELIEIYSNCEKEILYENLDLIYSDSLRNIYLLAYTAKKRKDPDLLDYAKKKFNEYDLLLSNSKIKINNLDEYYYLLCLMFSNINDFHKIHLKSRYLNSKITLENNIILEFRETADIEKIYRTSSEENKKQLALHLAFYYLKNNKKMKAMHFLFDSIKKDVCLKTNTITINNEDDKYFNSYFSYFLKCCYLRLKKDNDVDIKILDKSFNSVKYLSNDFKYAIEFIINYIIAGHNLKFKDVFNSISTKCNKDEYFWYIKDRDFSEFKILISCLIHFLNTQKKILDINSIKFLLDDKNIEKNIIFKLDNFLKMQIFDNSSISNIKNRIEEEFLSKIFKNDLEGSENKYISLFRLLKNYDQNPSDILFYFCRVSLSYGFSKDTNIYPLILSLYYLSDIDEKHTLILLNQILPKIFHISDFTNLKELKPAVYLFNCLLDRLYEKNKVFLNLTDIENIENYKNSKKSMFNLEDSKNACLEYKINQRSSSSNVNPKKYLNNEDNWYSSSYFKDDFFHYVDKFFYKNEDFEKNMDSIMDKLIYNKNSNIFPYHRLVYIFCKNGNNKDALILTRKFVEIFIEETAYLNIPNVIHNIDDN